MVTFILGLVLGGVAGVAGTILTILYWIGVAVQTAKAEETKAGSAENK